MKKAYVKPQIIIEDFSLSTNIALNCEVETSVPNVNDRCGIRYDGDMFDGWIIFSDWCDLTPQDAGGKYDSLCYDNPSEDYNLFAS